LGVESLEDWHQRAARTAALVVHGHGLLEAPMLWEAVRDLHHFVWLARASVGLNDASWVDSRLESLTSWLFLWRNVGAEGQLPPVSLSGP
jgi:hypothetical protein